MQRAISATVQRAFCNSEISREDLLVNPCARAEARAGEFLASHGNRAGAAVPSESGVEFENDTGGMLIIIP